VKQMAVNEKKDVVAVAEQLLANAVDGEWSYAPRMTQARGWSLSSTYFESEDGNASDQVFAAVEGDADPDTEELLLHTAKFLSKSRSLVESLVAEVKRLRAEAEAKTTQPVAATPHTLDNTLTLRKPQPLKATDRRLLPAELRPCPVTGILNRHRRFSYLMPEVRTVENLNKFKKTAGESRNALKMQPKPERKVEAVPPIRRTASR